MYLTQAIILKKIDTGEVDVLYSMYTKDFGLMRARAQGIRKQGAKLAGHLELLSHSTVGFVLGRTGERLIYAEGLSSWSNIRACPKKLRIAYAIVQLVDAHCFPGQPDDMLWEHISRSFNELECFQGNVSGHIEKFRRGFAQSLGYGSESDMRIFGEVMARPS